MAESNHSIVTTSRLKMIVTLVMIVGVMIALNFGDGALEGSAWLPD